MLVFVHRGEYLLFSCWRWRGDIELFLQSQIKMYPLNMFISPNLSWTYVLRLGRLQIPADECYTSVRGAMHHWTCLLIEFHIFKIIWDVLYWSQTHVRIYHSRLQFSRVIDNTFSDDWEQGYSTKIFFQYSKIFFLSKICADCKRS